MSIEERVARLEQSTTDMKESQNKIIGVVENIRDNHLHEIKSEISDVKDSVSGLKITMAYYLGGLAALIFIGDLLLRIYK